MSRQHESLPFKKSKGKSGRVWTKTFPYYPTRGKKGFVTATKLGTTNRLFVGATKTFAAATKCFVDRTKHFVVVT